MVKTRLLTQDFHLKYGSNLIETRVGKNKKEFIIYKFRSMHHAHSSYIGGREAMVKGSSAAFDLPISFQTNLD